jgi:ATP-dependent Clp protease ATP-binding subunit ClpA
MPKRQLTEAQAAATSAAARAALETYCHDLTALARQGRFAPLVGHEAEVERILQILPRKHRRNPMLIGDSGPERIAVVLEVVRRIAAGAVPSEVSIRRVLAVDLEALFTRNLPPGHAAAIAAAAWYWYLDDIRSRDVQKRLVLLFEGVRETAGEAILFFDDFHRVLRGPPEPSMDMAPQLKPFFGYRYGQILGTSSLDQYRQYVEWDAALQRRFQEVLMCTPSYG